MHIHSQDQQSRPLSVKDHKTREHVVLFPLKAKLNMELIKETRSSPNTPRSVRNITDKRRTSSYDSSESNFSNIKPSKASS